MMLKKLLQTSLFFLYVVLFSGSDVLASSSAHDCCLCVWSDVELITPKMHSSYPKNESYEVQERNPSYDETIQIEIKKPALLITEDGASHFEAISHEDKIIHHPAQTRTITKYYNTQHHYEINEKFNNDCISALTVINFLESGILVGSGFIQSNPEHYYSLVAKDILVWGVALIDTGRTLYNLKRTNETNKWHPSKCAGLINRVLDVVQTGCLSAASGMLAKNWWNEPTSNQPVLTLQNELIFAASALSLLKVARNFVSYCVMKNVD